MATIKNYTNIEQSKKLAEILTFESADAIWDLTNPDLHTVRTIPYEDSDYSNKYLTIIPAWSLAALLSVIPNYKLSTEHNYHTCTAETSFGEETVGWFDNPVDAVFEMILKLHKLKLL